MAGTMNYAAVHNVVVLVGHRSANGDAHTSAGAPPRDQLEIVRDVKVSAGQNETV
ncbi:MAG: hypothetical protein GX456_19050 [Verrucomicrobia bacterium]|nr:hypothetical protein [Verrucomicrobiota bacterium]